MLDLWIVINIKVFLVLFVYGMLVGAIRRRVCARIMEQNSSGIILNILNFVGTPVHETGHMIFALIFGIQIKRVCFYRTLRQARNGVLGYVDLGFKRGGIIRTFLNDIGAFFVGIGPLISGPVVIGICYHFLPQNIRKLFYCIAHLMSPVGILHTFERLDWVILCLFLYISIGIALNMELSRADLKMAWKGFIVLEIMTVVLSYICYRYGIVLF